MTGPTNHRAIRWLRAQLPGLVAGGVITSDNATAIDRHYREAESRATSFGFVILAVIGSALVGAGIVLLIAHNWDDLSRSTRCLIAFLPLLLAQVMGVFVLSRRDESPAWRESASIFNVAAVGTAIALVSQTYQIQGSLADFLGTWLLLSIPVVYLFRTTFGALAYMVGCAVWMVSRAGWSFNRPGQMFFWILLLLIAPFCVRVSLRERNGWRFRTLSIFLMGAAAVGLGVTTEFTGHDLGGVAFAGLCTTVYLAGMRWQEDGPRSLNVLSVLGGLGIAAVAIVLSFEGSWHLRTGSVWNDLTVEKAMGVGVALLFPAMAIGLAGWDALRGKIYYSIVAACLPLLAVTARLIAEVAPVNIRRADNPYAFSAAVLFNVYALALGIELLVRGIRVGSLARANFGLLVVASLALARFFDSDFSFVARGIGFIAVGAGFLLANFFFFRQRMRA